MNCSDPNNPDATWKLVSPNCTNPSICNTDPAYVAASTVCSQQLTIIEADKKTLLTMPNGSLEVSFYDGVKVKVNVIFENKDEDANIIKVYRNSSQTITGATYIGFASASEYVFVDDMGESGLDQTFFYYIQAVSTTLNIVSRYRLLGSVVTDEAPNILTTLTSDEPVNRVNEDLIWPITMGVPFAIGSINENEDVIQVSLNNTILPSQQKQTLAWPDASAKFLTIDFQATTNDLNSYESGITVNNNIIQHDNPVVATDNSDSIEINNGTISFTISKTSFKGIENLVHNGQQIISSSDFYWINHDDENFKAENFTSPEVTIETEGPLRTVIKAEGFFKYDTTESMKFRIRFHVFAGLPYIKINYTWIWTESVFSCCPCIFDNATEKMKLSPCYPQFGKAINATGVTYWATGQAVTFNKRNDATMPTGITIGTVYYLRNTGNESLSCDGGSPVERPTYTIHPTANDAVNNTNTINIGTDGSGVLLVNAHTPYIKDIGLKFNTPFTITETNTEIIEDGHVVAQYAVPATIVQTEFDAVEISDGVVTENVGNIAGWAEGSNGTIGLACSVSHMKYESTKQYSTNSNYLSVHIVAPDGPNFNWAWDQNIGSQQINSASLEHIVNQNVDPYGVAKTTEIWVWPTTNTTDNIGINDLVQEPPCVMTNPTYNCDTNVIINIRPASETPAELQFIESALERATMATFEVSEVNPDHFITTVEDYKMLDYGDVHLYRSGAWRQWDNAGHGSGRTPWIQFMRTGKRIYKHLAEIMHLHNVDVDTVNYGVGPSFAYQSPKTLGWQHFYSSVHWTSGPIFSNFGTHKESLIWSLGLTGHERFNDSINDCMAGNLYLTTSATATGSIVAAGSISRGQYGVIEPFMAYYQYDNNPTTLDGAWGWFNYMYSGSQEFVGFDNVRYNQQGDTVVPNNAFWYFYALSSRNLYYYLNDEVKKDTIKDLILRVAGDYAVQHTDHDDPAFFVRDYSSTYPHEIWTQWGSREMVTPYTFAYELTGNVNYLRNAIKKTVLFSLITNENGIASANFENVNHVIQNTVLTLGAWSNENFRLDLMHGGSPYKQLNVATTANSPFTYVSTHFFRKTEGVPGFIRIYFDLQTSVTTHVYYRLTRPDMSVVEVQISTGSPSTCYVPPKYEIDITNLDFDGYDYTFGEFKLEILSQFAIYMVVQSDMPKFVSYFPALFNETYSLMNMFPADASGTCYMKVKAGKTTIDITNLSEDAMVVSEEDTDLIVSDDTVPTNIENTVFQGTSSEGAVTGIAVDNSKMLKITSTLAIANMANVEPFFAVKKSKFFLPYYNPNNYHQFLTARSGVFSDDAATTNSVNNGVVAAWQNYGDWSHHKFIQTVNGSRPIYKTNSINGHPALDFSGSKFLHHEGSIFAGQSRGSFFIVFRANAISGNQSLFSSYYNSISYESFYIGANGSLNWSMNSGGGPYGRCLSGAGVISPNTTYVVTVSANDTIDSYIMRINGVQVATSGSPVGRYFVNNIRFALGATIFDVAGTAYGAAPDYFNGQIAEFKTLIVHDLNNDEGKVLEEEQKLLDKYL